MQYLMKITQNLFLILILLHNKIQRTNSLALNKVSEINRRDALIGTGLGFTGLVLPQSALADTTNPKSNTIAVLGASGRTGALCVTACLHRGIPVKALTRSGSWPPDPLKESLSIVNDNLLTIGACDVKDLAAIARSIAGCRAVIYAASASKQGGDAKAIDNLGVVSAAQACIDAKVSRFILVSSTAVTRPKSLGYKFTNVLGGIMDEKRKGEVAVQGLYQNAALSTGSYTIIRPGGLEEPKKNVVLGPNTLEVSQGDTLAGIISRADLAEVCVELSISEKSNLQNTALELYYTTSAQPCEGRFKSMLKDGIRLHGATYEELFQGIQPNVDFADI